MGVFQWALRGFGGGLWESGGIFLRNFWFLFLGERVFGGDKAHPVECVWRNARGSLPAPLGQEGRGTPVPVPQTLLTPIPPSDAGDTPDPGGGIDVPPKRGGPYNGITAQLPGAPGDAPSS